MQRVEIDGKEEMRGGKDGEIWGKREDAEGRERRERGNEGYKDKEVGLLPTSSRLMISFGGSNSSLIDYVTEYNIGKVEICLGWENCWRVSWKVGSFRKRQIKMGDSSETLKCPCGIARISCFLLSKQSNN